MSQKRVLAVHNFDHTGLGNLGTALAEAGIEIDVVMAHLDEPLPADASGHDAIVVLGGGQNARDDDKHPYFPALLDLIRDFEARDRAVLGICLGSQLMARAFGGDNRIGGATEFGWHDVTLTEESRSDAVLSGLPGSFPIFQWHDDTFVLPARAIHLAASPVATNQAFRIGRAAYGFQFHFEADRSLVAQWNRDFAGWIEERQPDWADRSDSESAAHGPAADAAGLAIARAWVAAI
ncbi:type 1 glutamine amidotransferase [Arvimicrobium flavum]|uniref:type 1 glutamine amidotransferase n=1 Tax=Arvimicrobium flavum TaxID=3393320 RepID=UPI00237AA796|nr:type 1 glutamine amidotransferase [Mesorhizobium shangrilense]